MAVESYKKSLEIKMELSEGKPTKGIADTHNGLGVSYSDL